MMISKLMNQKGQDYEEVSSKIYGVVTAVVTNTKDPKKKGRIKVKYVWMGEAKAIESDWARVMSFMAGNARGAHFLPDVDDEVLVMFEHGNINFPYVIGALYNEKDKVIEENTDGKNNIKMIKSRTGHKITFDDTKDKEKLSFEDSSGKRSIVFDVKEKKLTIKNDVDSGEIIIEAKGKVSIKSDKEIDIKGKADITIKSDKNVTIEGKAVTIKSTQALTLKAGTALKTSSSSATEFKAGSSMTIKGSASGKFEAPQLNFKASASGKFEAPQLALKGTVAGKFEALKLDLKATGMAELSAGGITTVKGAMVKVN
jgi:uncharacterized protein involved in type VI secretion and phage assembly